MSSPSLQDYVTRGPGFGAMSLSGAYGPSDDENGLAVLKSAYDSGCTFWDTASVYGLGHNERLIGRFLSQDPSRRQNVFIGSKCAWEFKEGDKARGGLTNTPEHVYDMIDQSIERLGTTPDLYYLHRRDPNVPLEQSIGAMAKIKAEGKCRYIGISEPSAETLRNACAIAHIDAIQIEYSPFCLDPETNGLLSTARELGVVVVAFSPLGVGVLTGKYSDPAVLAKDIRGQSPRFMGDALESNLEIVRALTDIAGRKDCTPAQLSIAWVSKQGAIPIPGTKSVGRLEENWGASKVQLGEEDMREIRGVIGSGAQGDRWPAAIMAMIGK